MNMLIAILPAFLWGILPLAISKVGGRPIHQILGTTWGTVIVAIVVYLIAQPEITTANFWWCFLSGAMWAGAQMLQYRSFELIGVSGGMPISTGMQLTANSVVGALFLGDWPTLGQRVVGFSAIALIIFGIWMTTRKERVSQSSTAAASSGAPGTGNEGNAVKSNMKAGILVLAIGTIGYVGFSFFPARFHVDGRAAFLPQALGMVSGALFFSLFYLKQRPFSMPSIKNMLGGFIFALAVLLYLISINLNGVSIAASMTQMNVILATLGGIYVLGEREDPLGTLERIYWPSDRFDRGHHDWTLIHGGCREFALSDAQRYRIEKLGSNDERFPTGNLFLLWHALTATCAR